MTHVKSLNADHWHVLILSHGLLPAMAVKVKHVDLAKHQCNTSQTLRQFWLDGELCDVVVKSSDGTSHPAHTIVLCVASKVFHNLLRGSFAEADQVRKGEPVEIAASEPVVSALLEYVYGGQPELPVDNAMELLRLADAYNLSDLAAAIEAGLRTTLEETPLATALNILKQTQGLHDLKAVCEEKVALSFEACLEEAAFLDLSEDQFGRILRREDLKVSREDIVLKGVFKWFNSAKAIRAGVLNLMLQHVDFQAISSGNLARIGHFASTLGPKGDELQREVHEALRAHKKRGAAETPSDFRPKRRCLKHCSAYLGAASTEAHGQKVLASAYWSLRWHEDCFYCVDGSERSIYRWKPGQGDPQIVVGSGAQVAGGNAIGEDHSACPSPDGRIIVADCENGRLVSFQNGFGQVLASGIEGLLDVLVSPNGVMYVLSRNGRAVQKLVGDVPLQLVIDSEHLPADKKFQASFFFVTREEVVYISDESCNRILRVNQGSCAPEVVRDVFKDKSSSLAGLFVTEDGKIYVTDFGQSKVLALNPGGTTWMEVLKCPDQMKPNDVVVHDGSLYVSMWKRVRRTAPIAGCVRKYDLPPELGLE